MSGDGDPFDHNAECRFCDEQAGHRADCPWLLALQQCVQAKDEELVKANEKVEEAREAARSYAAEVVEYEQSFERYHKASMALMDAYKRAHPDVPKDVWPDVGVVNAWAVDQIEKHLTYLEAEQMKHEVGALQAWKDAVIDALVVDCIYTNEHETDPRQAIADLCAWEVKIALDPAVSEPVAKLHQRIAELENALAAVERALRDEQEHPR
jgi:hypothetical protein